VTTSALTLDLLTWIASRPRAYDETIEAWKTSCPHLSIWDDAVTDGLVTVERDGPAGSRVRLSERGRALLAAAR
jgi:hypothetical protein